MPRVMRALVVLLALLIGCAAQTGCMTTKRYRMVKVKEQKPPAYLNLSAETDALSAVLVTVIVYHGPGSWKLDARWDEYVVRLSNRAPVPLTVDSAVLIDLLGAEQFPGDHPWRLERQSAVGWKRYAQVTEVVLGAGAAVGAMEVAALGYGLTGGVMSGIFFIMPVAVLADVAVVVVQNHRNKDRVEAEFDRRRLVLPISLQPGQEAMGSFFFPMVPGPQRLILKGRTGTSGLELELNLKPLAGLHLKASGSK